MAEISSPNYVKNMEIAETALNEVASNTLLFLDDTPRKKLHLIARGPKFYGFDARIRLPKRNSHESSVLLAPTVHG